MQRLHHLSYKVYRFLIKSLVDPIPAGSDTAKLARAIYIIDGTHHKDLILLEILAEKLNLSAPVDILHLNSEKRLARTIDLEQLRKTWPNLIPTKTISLGSGIENNEENSRIQLVPVVTFWGRTLLRGGTRSQRKVKNDNNLREKLFGLTKIFLHRKDVCLHFGKPIAHVQLSPKNADYFLAEAKLGRVLLREFHKQKIATIGPTFRPQKEILRRVINSKSVNLTIDHFNYGSKRRIVRNTSKGRFIRRARAVSLYLQTRRIAKKALSKTAANMRYPTIRILERLLSWFWKRIYKSIEINGLDDVKHLAQQHTLLYTPSHRSHLDYLLLSCLLHESGLMMPHIAAGENMNLPMVGRLLRHGGAFFMRRSFREDPIYSAVFSEYLYEIYQRGHCVEFFPEGGRSRTGRLLPARLGLIKTTIEHQRRGIPRPLSIIPVYFGYEKLIEANSYIAELAGSRKQKESLGDLIRSFRLINENFGSVSVNFGEPINLKTWLLNEKNTPENALPSLLGQTILRRINGVAAINPINLVATAVLTQESNRTTKEVLKNHIQCYLNLLRLQNILNDLIITEVEPEEIVNKSISLGMTNYDDETGTISVERSQAAKLTWYRNNIIHTLAFPSLIARFSLEGQVHTTSDVHNLLTDFLEYFAQELHIETSTDTVSLWIQHMSHLKLLELRPDGSFFLPPSHSMEYSCLGSLAKIMEAPLKRMRLITKNIKKDTEIPIDTLELNCREEALQISHSTGHPSTEYFEPHLFQISLSYLSEKKIIRNNNDLIQIMNTESSIFKLMSKSSPS